MFNADSRSATDPKDQVWEIFGRSERPSPTAASGKSRLRDDCWQRLLNKQTWPIGDRPLPRENLEKTTLPVARPKGQVPPRL